MNKMKLDSKFFLYGINNVCLAGLVIFSIGGAYDLTEIGKWITICLAFISIIGSQKIMHDIQQCNCQS